MKLPRFQYHILSTSNSKIHIEYPTYKRNFLHSAAVDTSQDYTKPKTQHQHQRRSVLQQHIPHINTTVPSLSSSHSSPHPHLVPLHPSSAPASPRHPTQSSGHQTQIPGNPYTFGGKYLRSDGAGRANAGPRSWRRVCGWCGRHGWCGSRRSGRS